MDVISQNDDKAFMKMYPKSKRGQQMTLIAKEDREQVSEQQMGDYALVDNKDNRVVGVGRLRDMRKQRIKMGRKGYDVYPARGALIGDIFTTTTCPPVNEDTTMNKDLIDTVTKIMMGEAKEKTMRQLVDPRKEVMVVKNNKVIVIDKKDQDKYMKMGYDLAEKEKLDPVNPTAVKKKFDDRKDKDIDNDGDVDSTDKYLHKRRKAISKAIKSERVTDVGVDQAKRDLKHAKLKKATDDVKKEEVELDEGYESEVMKVLNKADIDGYFKMGKLYVNKRDGKDAKKALEDSDEITKLPKMVMEEVDPADVDITATDKDVENASKNIILQLRKVITLRGMKPVEFASGKEKVNPNIAQKALSIHQNLRRTDEKDAFQRKIAKSYNDLLNAVKGRK